ncbi:MAG: hypothetical protein ABR548_11500 [Actinomycetota bacterium]|nr:hypothetical protein [Actinomycetota bacterium]
MKTIRRLTGCFALCIVASLMVPAQISWGSSSSFNATASGTNGSGTATVGTLCTDGGTGGSAWGYTYTAPLAAGVFTDLPTTLTLHLEVRSDAPAGGAPNAWLHGTESFVDLQNARGTLRMLLSSGSCAAHSMTLSGAVASGSGTWAASPAATGAFRSITGTGTFSLQAQLESGSANAFQLALNGSLGAPDPMASVDVASAAADKGHNVTVVYEVTVSPGDAYGLKVSGVSSPGAKLITALPLTIGDAIADTTSAMTLRFRVEPKTCKKPSTECELDTTLTFESHDALDVVFIESVPVHVVIPT